MDPLSIAGACVELAGDISVSLMKITIFAREVNGARRDVEAVARELISLQISVEGLRDERQTNTLPDNFREQVTQALLHCDVVIQQINDKLLDVQRGRLGRSVQWSQSDKDEVNALCSSLDSIKSGLDLALSTGLISMLASGPARSSFPPQSDDPQSDDRIELIRAEMADLNRQVSLLNESNLQNDVEVRQMIQSSQAHVTQVMRPLNSMLDETQDHSIWWTPTASPQESTMLDWQQRPQQDNTPHLCPECGSACTVCSSRLPVSQNSFHGKLLGASQNEPRRVTVPAHVDNGLINHPLQSLEPTSSPYRARLLCHVDSMVITTGHQSTATLTFPPFLDEDVYPLHSIFPGQPLKCSFTMYSPRPTAEVKREVVSRIVDMNAFKAVVPDDDCFVFIFQNAVANPNTPYNLNRHSLLMIPVHASNYINTGYESVGKGPESHDVITIDAPNVVWEMPKNY